MTDGGRLVPLLCGKGRLAAAIRRRMWRSNTTSRIPATNPCARISGGYRSIQTLHVEKLRWDVQIVAQRMRKRKLQEDREDAEWARSTGPGA